MRIDIQFVSMPTSGSMELYTRSKLERLFHKYDSIIRTTVHFKRELNEKVNGRICEMEVSLNGPRIHATANERNFELAVKNAISDLDRQLEKRKGILKPYA